MASFVYLKHKDTEDKDMPRKAREVSDNGIYYIYARSLENTHLCTMPSDFERLVEILKETKASHPFALFAFAITKCELHMVVREFSQMDISKIMKLVTGSFTKYRNGCSGTSGKLFKDRFKSSPAPLDDKFLPLIKFVHQAPMSSGETLNFAQYPYCSYQMYFNPDANDGLVDCGGILKYFDDQSQNPLQKFKIYHAGLGTQDCKMKERVILKREDVAKKIQEVAKMNPKEIKLQEESAKIRILKRVKTKTGLSIRQIAFATQMSRNTVSKLLNTKVNILL